MAPLKFEDKMQEQLEQRTIQPSEESWKKLEKLLDEKEEEKKNYKKFWWMGIAASFVGILIVASVFVKSDRVEDDPIKNYVDTIEKNTKINNNETQVVEVEHAETKNTLEGANETLESSNKNKAIDNNILKPSLVAIERNNLKNNLSAKKSESLTSVATTNKTSGNTLEVEDAVTIDSIEIQEKVIAIAAQVKELEQKDGLITDGEIDNLLLQAQKEITMERALNSNQINAETLLSDVESELDETFKEKVFEALKTGFQKIKSSVVERDN